MAPLPRTGTRWINILQEVAKDVRIASKEEVSEDEAGVPLVLWDSQKRFLKEVAEGLDNGIHIFVCLKSRQEGITTISLLVDLVWLAFHNNLICALVTDTEKNRDANRRTLRHYVNSFPRGYFGDEFFITSDNRQTMTFSNGCRIDFLVAGLRNKSTAWGEGVGYAFAHLTEVASYGSANALESFENSFAQSNPRRLFIYESTAKGFNHWKRKWDAAIADPYTHRAFFIGWWACDHNVIQRDDPRYLQYGTYPADAEEREKIAQVAARFHHRITPEQLAWIRWRDANSDDEQMMHQNQPWLPEEAFIISGYSFFQVRQIGRDLTRIDDDPATYAFIGYRYNLGERFFDIKLVQLLNDASQVREMAKYGNVELCEDTSRVELRVWEEPNDNGKYVIGFDPAWGRNDHKDRHAISVWRCYADRIVQVAEYATSDVEPKHAAWVCAHLAGAYKDCIVNVEINGPGRMIMQEWDHVRGTLQADYYREEVRSLNWEEALSNARWFLFHRADSVGGGYVYNFETNWKTKQEIMFQFRGSYVTNELVIRSRKLLEEMVNVVHDDGEIGAVESSSEDSKDDRVFAAALANRAWINWVRPTMLANGDTYDVVSRIESGERPNQSSRVLNQVYSFFRRAEERARDEELQERLSMSPTQRFLNDRGL